MPRPPHYTRHNIGPSPHRSLWAAVLELARQDAFAKVVTFKSKTAAPSIEDRDEARRLLFDPDGPWARARELICAAAGIEPDALIERLSRWQST